MIHINSYKLTPAITATWGDITGNVSNQEDLVEYINEHGTAAWGSISGNISDQSDLMSTLGSYATESWVSSQQFATESWVSDQGYLTSVPSEYATQGWVSEQGYLTSTALTGYATESWVSEQGYLTSTALSGYATESWVSGQGYLTEHQSLKTVNNQSLVGTGNIEISGGLDPEQEEAIEPLVENLTKNKIGYYKTDYKTKPNSARFVTAKFFDTYGQCYVWTINNEIYGINFLTPETLDETLGPKIYIYKFNKDTFVFEHILDGNGNPIYVNGDVPTITKVTDSHFLWEDSQHRVYYSNTHKVDLTTGTFTAWPMGGTVTTYNGQKNNIIVSETGEIWLLYGASNTTQSKFWMFNETTQLFELKGSGTNGFRGYRVTNWYRYVYYHYYNGRYLSYFTYPNNNTSGTPIFYYLNKAVSGFVQCTPITPDFPTQVYREDKKDWINITGDRLHTLVYHDDNEDVDVIEFYFIYGDDVWKLTDVGESEVDNQWVLVSGWDKESDITYNTNGAKCGQLIVGCGYNETRPGEIPVWNFGDTTLYTTKWDSSVDTRLTELETNIGSALEITQNILGY